MGHFGPYTFKMVDINYLQVSDECPGSYWDHLKVANEYEAPIGKVAEKNAAPTTDVLRTR